MKTYPPRRLLILIAGFTLWACGFLAAYGVNAIGCAFTWPHAAHRAVLVAIALLHTAALGWMAARCWRRRRGSSQGATASFVEFVGLGVTIAALAATPLTLAPAFVLSLCV